MAINRRLSEFPDISGNQLTYHESPNMCLNFQKWMAINRHLVEFPDISGNQLTYHESPNLCLNFQKWMAINRHVSEFPEMDGLWLRVEQGLTGFPPSSSGEWCNSWSWSMACWLVGIGLMERTGLQDFPQFVCYCLFVAFGSNTGLAQWRRSLHSLYVLQ